MGNKVCTFENCGRELRAKNLCSAHYQQVSKGQHLRPIGLTARGRLPFVSTIEEFFWARVDKTDSCWIWTGCKTTLRYGELRFRGSRQSAHRYSYKLNVGDIPEGAFIDHLCHNPQCVNPEHLRIATRAENSQNRKGASSNSKSGIRGVQWSKQEKKWVAIVKKDGKKYFCGYFKDINDADKAARDKRGELFSVSQ